MSFSLILNSSQGTVVNPGSQTSIQYNFNWSVLEDNTQYEMSFAFQSKDAGLLGANDQKLIRLNGIGCLNNTYNITSNGVATSSEIIGMVHPFSLGNAMFYYSGNESNAPIFIRSKPIGNNFRVEILNFDRTLAGGNYEWTLILHFKKVKT